MIVIEKCPRKPRKELTKNQVLGRMTIAALLAVNFIAGYVFFG